MREADVPEELINRPCPDLGPPPWAQPPNADRQVAIVSTAGLIQRGDRAFGFGAADYRIIDRDDPADLLMTHISTNFDRSGFLQDHEVVFPLKRLQELANDGEIDAVARYHYSFMGATDPAEMEPAARQLAGAMRGEGTNVVLLVPV
ncbi:MAG: glycine/sarcosine/betaine reductase selenoprotein B family protein [Pseudomonadales bacterium]